MQPLRRIVLFTLVGIITIGAFGAGYGAMKYRLFEHSPREFVSRLMLKLDGPEPIQSPYRSRLNLAGCQCAASWRICPCGSTTTMPPHEQEIWKQVLALPMPPAPPLTPRYRERLKAAVGYEAVAPRSSELKIAAESIGTFEGGSLEALSVDYRIPDVRLSARFAKHPQKSDRLLILLHGVAGNADTMLADYGRIPFRSGSDVLSFDVTSNTTLGGILNAAWQLQGAHSAGLWPRLVCDVAENLRLRDRYRRIVVYGRGDGARYAGYLANLCAPFDLVVMEGGSRDPSADYPDPLGRVYRLYLGYWHDHLTAFPAGTSVRDIAANARSPLVFLGSVADFRDRLRRLMAPAFEWRDGLDDGDAGVRLIYWNSRDADSAAGHLNAIVSGTFDGVDGATLRKRDID